MKPWILLLLASFILGGRAQRRGAGDPLVLILGACLLVAVALSMQRFV